MSAVPPIAPELVLATVRRLVPLPVVSRCSKNCLLDDLVGPLLKMQWNIQTESFCSLEVGQRSAHHPTRCMAFGVWTWQHTTLRHTESVGEVIDASCPQTNEVPA
jgi:hypothetical protein